MVKKAVIVTAGREGPLNGVEVGPSRLLAKVAGVGLLKRVILSARRAGIEAFVIVTGSLGREIREAIASDPQIDAQIDWVTHGEREGADGLSVLKARDYIDGPFCLLMSDILFDPQILRKLRQIPIGMDEAILCVDAHAGMADAVKGGLESDRVAQIGRSQDTCDAVVPGPLLCSPYFFEALERSTASGDGSLAKALRCLIKERKVRVLDMDGLFWLTIDTPEAIKQAERALFWGLGKPTDGFVSRHFNRKLSTRITRLLVHTPVTPNQVSVAAMLISFSAAWYVASGDGLYLALGGLLFQLASVVDGTDGELAKLKFMESSAGEWVDTLADNASYVVGGIGLVYGMYRMTNETYLFALGWVAVALIILNLSLMHLYLRGTGTGSTLRFSTTLAEGIPQEKRGWFYRVSNAIQFVGRRDFYAALFCLLALGNRLDLIYWYFVTGAFLSALVVPKYVQYMVRTHRS